jgi:hypothetical protein
VIEMGAAAELGRELADADDAHALPYFSPKSAMAPLFRRPPDPSRCRPRHVGLDLLVHEILDLLDLAVLDGAACEKSKRR